MKTRPIGIDDQHLRAVAAVEEIGAAARRAGRIIDRPQQARLALDEDQRLALVEDMVAERDAVGAGVEHLLADGLGDAEAAGRVLAIDDDEIERPAAAQLGQPLVDRLAAGAADHVAEEEEARPARVGNGWGNGSI